MDDWDAVSSPVEPQDDSWDAVSTTSTSQPRKPRQSVKPAVSQRVVLLALVGLVIVALASGITWFAIYHVSGIHSVNSMPTATVQAKATTQAAAASPIVQQIYNQATSGIPAVDDPLSDNRNSWGKFNTNWRGQCAFYGGAYHLTVSNPDNTIWCNSGAVSNFNNFALQVDMTIIQGDYGSIVFGQDANGQYSIDIHPNGAYSLYQSIRNHLSGFLRQDFSSAIKQGFNQANVITIIVNNNQFYFYANKQLLMNYYLPLYSGGGLDLAAVCVNQPTDIAYSNLKVWML